VIVQSNLKAGTISIEAYKEDWPGPPYTSYPQHSHGSRTAASCTVRSAAQIVARLLGAANVGILAGKRESTTPHDIVRPEACIPCLEDYRYTDRSYGELVAIDTEDGPDSSCFKTTARPQIEVDLASRCY
jgi:hypothetical protein